MFHYYFRKVAYFFLIFQKKGDNLYKIPRKNAEFSNNH